jgi:hypothetical protein
MQINKLSNYFLKAPQESIQPSSIVPPARLYSSVDTMSSQADDLELWIGDLDITVINSDEIGVQAQDQPPSAGSLIDQLQAAAQELLNSIAIATKEDILAQFSGPPVFDQNEYDDAWEMVDKTLNGVIRYGTSVTAVTPIIRRGGFGMDGLCTWLETCILEYRVDPVLLEGKVQCLLDAMSLLCVIYHSMLLC